MNNSNVAYVHAFLIGLSAGLVFISFRNSAWGTLVADALMMTINIRLMMDSLQKQREQYERD